MYGSHRGRRLLAAALVILAVLVVISKTAHVRLSMTPVEGLLSELAGRWQRVVAWAGRPFVRISQEIARLRTMRDENLMMRDTVLKTPWLEADLQEALKESQRLRDLLKFAGTLKYVYIPAEVVGRNPDNWLNTAIINKGFADGVSVNDSVVTSLGLVGRVTKVTRNTATVMLMLDPDSGVGGLVQRSRDAGVVVGVAGGGQTVSMKLFPRDPDVKAGDVIITSGLGSFFPKGLPIGKVVSVSKGEYGLVKVADIQPFVNFDRLEEVLVLKPSEPVTEGF
ncbi:MAG: rod shape-determining protein MreC [Bacillota bacterium]|nr:rod shape-determining protein MreC [Bacillota bacterium]